MGCPGRLAIVLLAVASTTASAAGSEKARPILPVPLRDVVLEGGFWGGRLDRNRTVTIPHIFRENEETGRVANFEKAAGLRTGAYQGRRFNDTDVYKAIEAASETLVQHPDPALAKRIDALGRLIARSQQPDGYLMPARTIDPARPAAGLGPRRWMYLYGSHELYNAGHFIEAAVAHFQATGERTLLGPALRLAGLLVETFGPGRLNATSGHEEVELALIRLTGATGDGRYLELARELLDRRGHPHATEPYPPGSPFAMYDDPAYRQDAEPVVEQSRAMGHAVRAMYLYSAMTDVARLQGDSAYGRAVERIWRDVVGKRLYLTGAVGSRGGTESFGDPYELPNATAYAETCASVGNVLWNHRMFLATGEGRYLDVLERALYNGALAGVSASGDRFFYENPLASPGGVERKAYFEVACCPANLARLLAGLPGLLYARQGDTIYVGLFAASRATVDLGGSPVTLTQQTRYPWDGRIRFRLEMDEPRTFTLALRIPGWVRGAPVPSDLYRYLTPKGEGAVEEYDGQPVGVPVERGFARLTRRFRPGDVVTLTLPMVPRRVVAHPAVAADAGRVALERGPLVYALEQADAGPDVGSVALPDSARLTPRFLPALLGGIEAIEIESPGARPLRAIPYFAWDNRGPGKMAVWLERAASR